MHKAELAEQLNQVHAEVRQVALGFPPALRTARPGAEEWSAMELLGHLAEMHFYHVGRAERLLATGVVEGREASQPQRLGGVARGGAATLDELLAWLEEGRQYTLAFLERVSEADLAMEGSHPRLGPTTVGGVVERAVLAHARTHLEQLRQTERAVVEQRPGDGA
ncbi:MAG: DinB family protein [Chloroflexi bacterium]|nr:DinB family protein [Chloroflexota bacterium]